MGPPQQPVPASHVDPFDPTEVAVAVRGLKAVGAGPSGLRPTLLALALVGPAMMRAAAKVCTRLLCDRPPWVFKTRPLVVSKEGGGCRVIEMAEPFHHLLELLVMQRCAPSPVQDVAAMAVITRARAQRGDELVVADVRDGFNAVPHDVLLTWARLRPESHMLVSAQLTQRCLVDELGGEWTRDRGGPTGARTTCAAFCAAVRGALPPGVHSYVDDVVCPWSLWPETKAAVEGLGLEFAQAKTFGFNLPKGSGIAEATTSTHVLGAPMRGVSRRIRGLEAAAEALDVHDALTITAGGLLQTLIYDLCVGEEETLQAAEALVTRAVQRAQLGVEALPISPAAAAAECTHALLVRMLTEQVPHAWDLFRHPTTPWFARADGIFRRRGFTADLAREVVISPQRAPIVDVPRKYLANAAKANAAGKAHRAVSLNQSPPDSNVITQLLLAGGARPTLSDAMVKTAADLRIDDAPTLAAVAGATCPLCTKVMQAHHPLLCSAINHRGTAHDSIVRKLAHEVSKNPTLTVRANKAFVGPNGKDPAFRPDIAVEETNQIFEVKTVNSEAHGSDAQPELLRVAHEAHGKYEREVKRTPLVIATTTDGFVSKEGFASLKALTNTANQDMTAVGPRLMLIAGFALCEAASGAYQAWHWEASRVRAAVGA